LTILTMSSRFGHPSLKPDYALLMMLGQSSGNRRGEAAGFASGIEWRSQFCEGFFRSDLAGSRHQRGNEIAEPLWNAMEMAQCACREPLADPFEV
jgi:hypothetical protein